MRAILLVLLLAACGEAPGADTAVHTRLVVAPEIADVTIAAVTLWGNASAGGYAPEIVISSDCPITAAGHPPEGTWCVTAQPQIEDCGLPALPFACTTGLTRGTIRLATGTTPEAWHVSTVAHELGHTLDLVHTPGTDGLMDPERSESARRAPCVDLVTVEAAGFEGPGACL